MADEVQTTEAPEVEAPVTQEAPAEEATTEAPAAPGEVTEEAPAEAGAEAPETDEATDEGEAQTEATPVEAV